MFSQEIKEELIKVFSKLNISLKAEDFNLEHPTDLSHGDYSTSVALQIKSQRSNIKDLENPRQLAEEIVKTWQEMGLPDFVEKVEVAGAGFINIWANFESLGNELSKVLIKKDEYGKGESMVGKKIMVEFAHPNTHKELHIGHMRTLITGEALSRIFAAAGAEVFRANYQGDIGPHVAKSIWGTLKMLKDRGLKISEAEGWNLAEKAHLLGEGYVLGVKEYENSKEEIDELNKKIYDKEPSIKEIYETTRRWSLNYYDSFYTRFSTKFDSLFFESETASAGKKLVEDNVAGLPAGRQVFEESEGAVIFDGEKYGLHKRVFITSDGNPTYEAKEMGLAYAQEEAFPFDLNVHVVANEQSGYFQVAIKALETLDSKFVGREFHLPMGMVNLVGKKMSSRTGEIMRVDELLEEVKNLLRPLIQSEGLSKEEMEKIAEVGTIAAVKYSVLKVDSKKNVVFDPEKSVSLQGDSGPYLEYTYARTQSVLAKSKIKSQKSKLEVDGKSFSTEEQLLLRTLYKFPEVVGEAAKTYFPNLICNFLFDLAQKFNLFYDKERILGSENESFRLKLTAAVGQVLKNGLTLLGIEALPRL